MRDYAAGIQELRDIRRRAGANSEVGRLAAQLESQIRANEYAWKVVGEAQELIRLANELLDTPMPPKTAGPCAHLIAERSACPPLDAEGIRRHLDNLSASERAELLTRAALAVPLHQ